ncbi:MAG TPA: hypothetical protein VF006_20425 [Longimicrobium sp.]
MPGVGPRRAPYHDDFAQEAPIPHHSGRLRVGIVLALLALGACARDRAHDAGEPTDAERSSFTAPVDSTLDAQQVDRYLRTTLAQLDLLRAEAPAVRARMEEVGRERAKAAPAPKLGARPRTPQALWGDFVDAAYVRAARKLRYNPAELWYVRARVSAVSRHLLTTEMHASRDQSATLFRQQAESMRGTPGVTQAQIDAMLNAAEQAERQTASPAPPPRVAQNLAALRQARGGLGDVEWRRIASVAGGVGLSDLGQVPEAELDGRLDEIRTLYLQALEEDHPPG